jgi:ribosomal protein S10
VSGELRQQLLRLANDEPAFRLQLKKLSPKILDQIAREIGLGSFVAMIPSDKTELIDAIVEKITAEADQQSTTEPGPMMFSLAASRFDIQRLAEPSFSERDAFSSPIHKKQDTVSAKNIERDFNSPSRDYGPQSEINSRQGIYATASGTLTQFNAIVSAIHCSAITTAAPTLLKGLIACALLWHVAAAFVLCWAARPIAEEPPPSPAFALVSDLRHSSDTFRNYRRGWLMTLIALSISMVALAMFLAHIFEVSIGNISIR